MIEWHCRRYQCHTHGYFFQSPQIQQRPQTRGNRFTDRKLKSEILENRKQEKSRGSRSISGFPESGLYNSKKEGTIRIMTTTPKKKTP